ncbi:hypothetical protein OPT61_g1647 [Boeremia exigua]|uniref:Uncharacterized protein n=1 Tax=Boeremia exigua TaxID=749465 RepID=A0ACC2IPB4_9PLEO|nr:hypothetical protein OPT61_g1647 [Boeremia exigua]
MADGSITSRPYAGLPQNTPDDRERARELYKYFRPPVAAEPIDTVLTAHAQLASWRLNAERAMISLIDEETQYFVAESTKTVHLDDSAQYDDPEDAIWAGCVRVPKAGRLCEHTISTPPPPEGGPACFEVLDLSKDERFNQLSFIAGPPYFKYYAGVPLRTSRGINIGSIYILDSRLRAALTRNEKHFLGVMADNVIQHIEMSRDKKDRKRAFRMNECLSAYVDPASEDTSRRRYSNRSQSTEHDSDAESRRTTDGYERIEIIARAGKLLQEAMDIEEGGGGVLYLDTSLAVPSQQPAPGNCHASKVAVQSLDHEPPRSRQHRAGSNAAIVAGTSSQPSSLGTGKERTSSTEILAHAYQPAIESSGTPEFVPFTPEELLKIIKRYPRGRLFTYDQQGQELSESSDNDSLYNGRLRSKRRRQRSAADSAILHTHFPKARQVMFTPIWDSTTSRSAACFIYNCSEYRNFSHQLEFLNFIAFNNCVDTELLRLANQKTAEQKSDFIGSISHELRSPLHGILASCEFLQGTMCTSFQQSLIRTADGCARTLLDTVNMILDYSKINAFEQNKSGSIGPIDGTQTQQPEAFQTNLNTHRNVDLAILTEEVVEGVATGHIFSEPSSHILNYNVKPNGMNAGGSLTDARRKSDVELIVEISEQNWTSWCEPGTIRRIVMNLVGNALKYTEFGFVHVKLESWTADQEATEYGILTVKDSGRGISPAYLKDKLYTPFVQESNQAPGVGLGLSLVKAIVDKIGGYIDIESTIGVGTKATVKFPIKKEPLSNLNVESSTSGVKTIVDDDNIRLQRTAAPGNGTSIALYYQAVEGARSAQQEASKLMRETLTAYLKVWSGKPVVQWQENCTADIIVVEDSAFDSLIRRSPSLVAPGCQTTVLVLQSMGSVEPGTSKNVETLRHPIGPHKLARALQVCLDRSEATSMASSTEIAALIDATVHLDISIEPTSEYDCAPKSEHLRPDHLDKPKSFTGCTTTPESLSVVSNSIVAPDLALLSPTRRMLLVDDNTINLRLLQVGMKKCGYTSVLSASDGLQAVNTYRKQLQLSPSTPPDIILMDLSMPIMNGFEATRQIREIEAEHNSQLSRAQAPLHSLIIALTGLASVRDQKEAYTAGVDSYIMKPVSFAKLTALLEDWTAGGKVCGNGDVPGSGLGAS